MAYAIQFAGKSGPSVQININGSTITKTNGCYLSDLDGKFYSVDAKSNVIFQKTATNMTFKFYVNVTENAELPATPSSEIILESSDFLVKSSGSNILQATELGGGGGSGTYADGTASAPSLNFANETKSGFYRVGANQVGFSINEIPKYKFDTSRITHWADNDGSTNFGQFNILGLTSSTKYLAAGFNTTANYGMLEAGDDGTGYYNLVLNRNASSNVLVRATANTYNTRLFTSGTVGASDGLILPDGSSATPAFRFNGALTTGFYLDSSELKFGFAETEMLGVSNTKTTITNLSLLSDTNNVVGLRAKTAATVNYILNLPSTLPSEFSILRSNGSSVYSFVSPLLGFFGTGVDGDLSYSGAGLGLSNDMYYNNVTLSGVGNLQLNGYRVFVKGTLTFDNTTSTLGSIRNIGGNGSGSTAGAATTAGMYIASGAGSTGGAGGTTTGSQAAAPATVANAIGSQGGTGRPGSAGTSGAGGALRAGATITTTWNWFRPEINLNVTGTTKPSGGSGGGGGGGGGGNGSAGGAGGGGGGGGGIVIVLANIIEFKGTCTAPLFSAKGGNGGNGTNGPAANRGAGGGGGGGGGGYIMVICKDIIGTPPTDWIDASGGAGGNGGNGTSPTLGAQGGDGGSGGCFYYICISRNVNTGSSTRTSGSIGGSNSGQTGGTGGAGGSAVIGSTY